MGLSCINIIILIIIAIITDYYRGYYYFFLMQLMESGVHGPAGLHVVKHVVTVSGRENDSAIIPNPPTMAEPVRVLDTRKRNAKLLTAAQVRD